MSAIKLSHATSKVIGKIEVPGSKSESNRLLLLKHLYFPNLNIGKISDSRDTSFMKAALESENSEINIGDAGTAMRFNTAFNATKAGRNITLSGSERMHERPIGILVDALNKLGAKITYLDKEGYPPLKIEGQQLAGGTLEIDGSVSSQFISALMMIGPGMKEGIHLKLKGFSVSAPYIYLTANLMRKLGFDAKLDEEDIIIPHQKAKEIQSSVVEPDWSAASYWYAIALLTDEAEIYLPGFLQHSLQGDASVRGLFEPLGIQSLFIGSGFRLKKGEVKQQRFDINLVHNPDLAQTLAVVFAAKNLPAKITGLQTLRIKETDRLKALKTELEKTGAEIEIGDDFLEVKKGIQNLEGVIFDTYEDHRMAMAFAPLALMAPITINNPEVVAKSYQSFWEDLEAVGFLVSWDFS
ncbi:5-enolpyruvylshikimate-3-phosphate synthase [Owenweeksia hongkongensis DSM 17368]|uniref:3-phosphoshikimate 1-carboxyvinyltransferase n=1 Tax=Owenweeksia hongkongensis (strain DSM 17368 / CIP 108786 / JCM 12287 / NRRL B-23963 / UST20020801) TaxID=926562 RepID=G8R189_OWEHD|nr:3-phosphoshikimate 1-carboxyvinyltransferase [Owenweeksia hongkongensis]AEV32804.1 5-enolpyruvylshikimate-3-phosphate synthase [Owenweeksia hongkongensis DSM 17368]